jgi:hypothetical protein
MTDYRYQFHTQCWQKIILRYCGATAPVSYFMAALLMLHNAAKLLRPPCGHTLVYFVGVNKAFREYLCP